MADYPLVDQMTKEERFEFEKENNRSKEEIFQEIKKKLKEL